MASSVIVAAAQAALKQLDTASLLKPVHFQLNSR